MTASLDEIKTAVRQLSRQEHQLLREWLLSDESGEDDASVLPGVTADQYRSFVSAAAHDLILVDSPDAGKLQDLLTKA